MQGESSRPPVLVLGASGFIGGAVAMYLQEQSYEVYAAPSSQCDLLDLESIRAYWASLPRDIRVVFCAAITRQRDSSAEAMMNNLRMVEHFNAASREFPVASLIYLSTMDVYGIPAELPIREETPLAPTHYYGLSKMACEYMIQSARHGTGQHTILRLPGIYGPGDANQSTIGNFYRAISRDRNFRIEGGGNARRDYVTSLDLCRLIHYFLCQPYEGVLNVATGGSVSIREMVEALADALAIPLKIDIYEQSEAPQYDLVFQTRLLKDIAPHIVFTSVLDGIREYVAASA